MLGFLWVWTVTIASVIPSSDVHTKGPNIIMIVADDLGYNDVGFRGSHILTPNIDKLAGKSVILENHILSATCSPSRASLMTGRYPIRTGLWTGNSKPYEEFGVGLDETLLPEMLKRNGYATHAVGKWHLGMYSWEFTPVKRGFDTFFGFYLSEQDYFTHKEENRTDLRENFQYDNGDLVDNIRDDLSGQYDTYLFTNKSVELIKDHDQSKPFFLYLAYNAPHSPHQAPKEDVIKFASHINGTHNERKYAAMISVMDDGVGKVVRALNRKGMMKNTILVFTSDNGGARAASNYPLRGGKRSFFEGGVRGVTFVHSKLLQISGYTNTHLHHVTDWYATFQKLVGDKLEKHRKPQLPIDGVDIWKSISKNRSCRDEVLYELRDPTKRMDYLGREALENANRYPRSTNTSLITLWKTNITSQELREYAQDFFVLRWKNWKLLMGTGLALQGWTSESGMRAEYQAIPDNGLFYEKAVASGTFLFDLSTDVREEHNVADKYPDILKKLLDKKQGYLDKVKISQEKNFSPEEVLRGMVDGIWEPWVKM